MHNMKSSIAMFISVCALISGQACAQPAALCPPAEGVALQVLGSGGPIADDARASTAYIVWIDGKSRVLIDAGGGSFLRFGEAGASFSDLEFIGLSHFHADHSADFVALLKSGNFAGRQRSLTVAGPSGSNRFPGLDEFLQANLNAADGAFRYLAGYLDGSGNLPRLDAIEISEDAKAGADLLADQDSISVYAQHVPHGIVPALGIRVEVQDKSIVFSSDQNGSNPEFGKFAQDASLLVMHMPIPENAGDAAKQLHAVPSRIAEIAAAAHADRLLLSHFMARSLSSFDENVQIIREGYNGDLFTAEDLGCFALD
jgi:ribonuclease BN (tRNA processing enzyme)